MDTMSNGQPIIVSSNAKFYKRVNINIAYVYFTLVVIYLHYFLFVIHCFCLIYLQRFLTLILVIVNDVLLLLRKFIVAFFAEFIILWIELYFFPYFIYLILKIYFQLNTIIILIFDIIFLFE
jgi:hypothetical protein